MSRPTDGAPTGTHTVHVRENSDSELQALFDVLKRDGTSNPKPLNKRKFPESFFKPPEPRGVHSREGSQDSAAGGFSNVNKPKLGPHGLPIMHGHSKSCPSQLVNNTLAPTPTHTKQPSADFIEDMPPNTGWDPQHGQRYIVNPNAWQQQLSVKSLSNQSLSSGTGPQQVTPTLSPSHSLQHSPAVSMQDLGPLPPGWEQGLTPEGEVYFINHLEKATSWFDPRIPKHLQRPGPMTSAAQIQSIPKPQQQIASLSQPPTSNTPISVTQPSMSVTPASQNRQSLPDDQFFQSELQKLEREKERLRREQDEIRRKEMLLNKMMSEQTLVDSNKPPSGFASPHQVSPMPAAVPTAITKIDPFLGHAGNTHIDSHARQSSADSGLGMGTGYSLPRTPEDILTNVDETMDTSDGAVAHKVAKRTGPSSDFNMNDLQGSVGMDVGGMVDYTCDSTAGMDGDELIPSLQEDLGNDLLNMQDIDPKVDNLTWL